MLGSDQVVDDVRAGGVAAGVAEPLLADPAQHDAGGVVDAAVLARRRRARVRGLTDPETVRGGLGLDRGLGQAAGQLVLLLVLELEVVHHVRGRRGGGGQVDLGGRARRRAGVPKPAQNGVLGEKVKDKDQVQGRATHIADALEGPGAVVVLGVEALVLRGDGEVEAELVALGLAEGQVGVVRVEEAQRHLVQDSLGLTLNNGENQFTILSRIKRMGASDGRRQR